MRVAIVGSRIFDDDTRRAMRDKVNAYVRSLPRGTTVVSGGAHGVDTWAETAARRRRLPVIILRPNWNRDGRRAGFLRNVRIVALADQLVAFWDGESRGTAHSIRLAQEQSIPVTVITP